MAEIFTSVITILRKGNLIIVLLSIAVAILVYKCYDDLLWSLFSLCITYPILSASHYLLRAHLYNNRIKTGDEKSEKDIKARNEEITRKETERLRAIYYSLSDEIRQNLILLCKTPKPDGVSEHTRILNLYKTDHNTIISACQQVASFHFGLLKIEDSIDSVIITIDPILHWVIDEDQCEKEKLPIVTGTGT